MITAIGAITSVLLLITWELWKRRQDLIGWWRDRVKKNDLIEDFGPLGILMRDPVTDEFRPLLQKDLDGDDLFKLSARWETETYWLKLEAEALRTYGPAILEPQ